MKPKFEYINLKDMPIALDKKKDIYIVVGGRGSCKSQSQLELMRRIMTLYDDIEACNFELAKIERRNNDRTN